MREHYLNVLLLVNKRPDLDTDRLKVDMSLELDKSMMWVGTILLTLECLHEFVWCTLVVSSTKFPNTT